MFKVLIIFIFAISNIVYAENLRNCVKCHKIEKIDNIHKLSCIDCHVLKINRSNIKSHAVIIKNPSSFKFVDKQCGNCHAKDINQIKYSLHGTLSSCINITRYTWHAQKSFKPLYGLHRTKELKKIPLPKIVVKKPPDLVDNLLRKKCLRCHLENNSYPARGTYRANGCAACHMEYLKNGRYSGSDKNMFGKLGYSKAHRLYKYPKLSSCLACHNNEFVGTDYVGLFPQDYDRSFRSPILKNGRLKPKLYGIGQHHLSEDIHFAKGLTCVDCHKKEEVMGDDKIYTNELDAIKVKCSSCHGGYKGRKPDSHFVKRKDGNYFFKSVNGKNYKLTLFNNKLRAHKYHSKVSCSACHAAWQYGNFQLNLYFDKTRNYRMWRNLFSQEDPYLERFLESTLTFPKIKPAMMDYVDHKLSSGIWYSGWLARRWSFFILVKGIDGLFYIGRPIFQYRLTYKDSNGAVIFDNVDNMSTVMPYIPHTISLYGKTCEACHRNKFILNTKEFEGTAEAEFFKGTVLFGRKLNDTEKKKLVSKKYKRVRFLLLKDFIEPSLK